MEGNKRFDIAVIGGGPGGYPAAIRAAQNGASVALIEATGLGGTCLNRGCIPSKALIAGADIWRQVQQAEEFGIEIHNPTFNYAKLVARKDRVVSRVRSGLEGLIASNKISLFKGFGAFTSPHTIAIEGEKKEEIYAEKIIIATGSEPKEMAAFPCDGKRIHNSTTLLDATELPKRLAIIGGGIIGCEFASLYRTFGAEVLVLELLPRLLPMESVSVSNALTKAFKKRGIEVICNVSVETISKNGEELALQLAGADDQRADLVLVATGRTLNTSKLRLEKAGVRVEENGMILVNDKMETTVPGIYAVGDIASKWWLAHVASHQGLVAANNATGHPAKMHYRAVPSVIFTDPEIGTVGYTLEEAIEKGYSATVGAFPFQALGKAQASFQTEGFAQIVTDKRTGELLGAQVVGHDAGTLVAEMGVAIANEMTIECISETIHAHPTVAEAWMEAALVAQEQPLHLPPKKS